MSKIRRKVTVENSKTISDSSSRRPSVFERLGPSTGSNPETHCRNWLKTGSCIYGNTCRFTHGTQPRGKVYSGTYRRSPERPTGDLRERMKNKRQEAEPDTQKRNPEEPGSPAARRDSSRSRHREKEDIKITKERTPESEDEPAEWEASREDSDNGDYDYELSLEMKRQKIQRELMKLEQENMEKREDIVIKKEEQNNKSRNSNLSKISPEPISSKGSPSSRKSSGSPKHKASSKAVSSSKKEKKTPVVSSPVSDQARSSKIIHGKKKGPRTPSPPPPAQEENPVSKKHKGKHKTKEKVEEKPKEAKDRGRDAEKHKEKKEKRRDRSESSHKLKRSLSPEARSGSSSSPSRETSPSARRKSASPGVSRPAAHKVPLSPSHRSSTPPPHRHTPTPPRHHSPSSHSGSSAQRPSPSPRRRRSASPYWKMKTSLWLMQGRHRVFFTHFKAASLLTSGIRGSRGAQLDGHSGSGSSFHENWESRGSYAERGSDRGAERERYEADRREQARDASFDRRGGHAERDRRDARDRDQRAASPARHQGRSDEPEREDRRDERRADRGEDRREDRARERERDREREREREREKEKEREREKEREKEREAERERARERERERERDREREREREERERERKDREREREQRERDRQRDWDDRDKGREERRDRRDEQREDRVVRDAHEDRKPSRKRHRVDSSPSPRPSPKRARDASPDSDGYNSAEEKSEKHRLLSQVVRPQDPSRSPPRPAAEEKAGRWKEEDRKAERKDGTRTRHEEPDLRDRGAARAERQRDHLLDTGTAGGPDPRRGKEPLDPPAEEREAAHEEGKKKTKSQKKGLKKNRKEEDGGSGTERFNPEPPAPAAEEAPLQSPRKGPKKKTVEKKRKHSRGGESDISEEEAAQPPSKKKRGPRTPPLLGPSAVKDGYPAQAPEKTPAPGACPPHKADATFSDWSDEDVPERADMVSLPPVERERAPPEAPKKGLKGKERAEPPIAPLLAQEPPSLLQQPPITLQPLMPQHLLRKVPEQKRSNSQCSNQSRASSRHLRSPSSESTHRGGEDHGVRRRRLQGGSRDRDRDRDRDKGSAVELPVERKSRIDQLKRGEPSRSTSSDRQDSRSHSSRRSSPESERQARSRAGSYDSRERERDREPFDRDRERKDGRDWGRGREPVRSREPRKRDADPERERHPPEAHERDRDRERLLEAPAHSEMKRTEPKPERDLEPVPRESMTSEAVRPEKTLDTLRVTEDVQETEKPDSVDGEDDGKADEVQSMVSGGEEYEPISDDELDEILADSAQKKEDHQDEENMPDPLDVIDVDWSSLMPKQKKESREAGAALLKFTPGAVLLRTGISKRLAGADLFSRVKDVCSGELEDPKGADKLFEHELGALNMAALNRREERAGLLSNLGPCCKALCSRRDIAIRKQLLKNDKGATKQVYASAQVVDNELLQLSIRLFKRKTAGQPQNQEKTESSTLSPPSAQPEVCVT
nr:PREDICTED: zinc finger CCCH domain-containing protein 13 [Lepisosteus oculatus]